MSEETTPSEAPIATRSLGLSLRMVLCTDSAQYLSFKDPETVLHVVCLLFGLWTPQNRFRVMTDGTTLRRHRR